MTLTDVHPDAEASSPAHGETEKALSVYLPNEALQGEDIPSFALWQNGPFQKIEVDLPEDLTLQDLFNVSKRDVSTRNRTLIVERVEVDGYLDMLLKSTRFGSNRHLAHVHFRFFRQTGGFESRTASIEMYRPLLTTVAGPFRMVIDPERSQSKPLLPITKIGDGTVMLWVKAQPDSEVNVDESQNVRELRLGLARKFEPGFAHLLETFTTYNELLVKSKTLLMGDPNFSDEKWTKNAKHVLISLRQTAMADNTFAKAFVEMVADAFVANLHLFNPFEQLRDYLQSIEPKKVLLQNPLDAIKFHQGPQELKLKIEYTDLTFEYYPPYS